MQPTSEVVLNAGSDKNGVPAHNPKKNMALIDLSGPLGLEMPCNMSLKTEVGGKNDGSICYAN